MFWADERAAIELRLRDNFNTLTIQYPGVPFDIPEAGWVRLNIMTGDSKRITLGPGGSVRIVGMIVLEIYMPANFGCNPARAVADELSTLFNEAQFSQGSSGLIVCWQPHLDDRGVTKDGNWYQVNVLVEYHRDVVPA